MLIMQKTPRDHSDAVALQRRDSRMLGLSNPLRGEGQRKSLVHFGGELACDNIDRWRRMSKTKGERKSLH